MHAKEIIVAIRENLNLAWNISDFKLKVPKTVACPLKNGRSFPSLFLPFFVRSSIYFLGSDLSRKGFLNGVTMTLG